jgi:hypothetical protein
VGVLLIADHERGAADAVEPGSLHLKLVGITGVN